MGVVEVSDLLPAVEANRVDNRLVVVGSHARGKVQGARGGRQDLEGRKVSQLLVKSGERERSSFTFSGNHGVMKGI